jgi:hypothetical protein
MGIDPPDAQRRPWSKFAHGRIRPHGRQARQATLYVVGHVWALHLQADVGRDRQAVPTHIGTAAGEHAGPL